MNKCPVQIVHESYLTKCLIKHLSYILCPGHKAKAFSPLEIKPYWTGNCDLYFLCRGKNRHLCRITKEREQKY